jgi:hypothetical protein
MVQERGRLLTLKKQISNNIKDLFHSRKMLEKAT